MVGPKTSTASAKARPVLQPASMTCLVPACRNAPNTVRRAGRKAGSVFHRLEHLFRQLYRFGRQLVPHPLSGITRHRPRGREPYDDGIGQQVRPRPFYPLPPFGPPRSLGQVVLDPFRWHGPSPDHRPRVPTDGAQPVDEETPSRSLTAGPSRRPGPPLFWPASPPSHRPHPAGSLSHSPPLPFPPPCRSPRPARLPTRVQSAGTDLPPPFALAHASAELARPRPPTCRARGPSEIGNGSRPSTVRRPPVGLQSSSGRNTPPGGASTRRGSARPDRPR
jgi:hypothetical protein